MTVDKLNELLTLISFFSKITGQQNEKLVTELNQIMEYRIRAFLTPTDAFPRNMVDISSLDLINQEFLEIYQPFAKNPRKLVNDFTKEGVVSRDGDRCQICGKVVQNGDDFHIDHIRSVKEGGNDQTTNLQLLCQTCNLGKGEHTNLIVSAPWRYGISPSRLKVAVLLRDRQCCVCQKTPSRVELTMRRRIPLSRGGRWIYDNLETICIECEQHAAVVVTFI